MEAVALGISVFMKFAYGDPVQKLRDQVWKHTRYSLERSGMWFIIGD